MMLSIEVLPAPFGPIMARISPLRISNDTSLTAFTPPNDSETLSTARSTSPTAISGPPVALMGSTRERLPASCRLLPAGGGHRLHVADLHARGDHALAA